MVWGGTGDTLQNLNRVAWDAAATAVMKWAAEARLILIVRVNVDVLVLLEAAEMIVFLAWTNDALLNLIWWEVVARSWALHNSAARLDFNLLRGHGGLVSNNLLLWLGLHSDWTKLLTYVARRLVPVAANTQEALHLDGLLRVQLLWMIIADIVILSRLQLQGEWFSRLGLLEDRLDGAWHD